MSVYVRLCFQQLRGADNALSHSYVWDPTEPIATCPLIFLPSSGVLSYYFHDGNKNVSDLVDIQGNIVHYAYTPFGTPIASAPSKNSYSFSSEVYDNTLGLIYYNYRHYFSSSGRWVGRDIFQYSNDSKILFFVSLSLYDLLGNAPTYRTDILGAAYIAKRPLDIPAGGVVMNLPSVIGGVGGNALAGVMNLGPWHEQIVYEDGKDPSDEGFFSKGNIGQDPLADRLKCCEFWVRYNDELMRKAVENVTKDMEPYDLLSNNCQDFIDMAKGEYYRLQKEQKEKQRSETPKADFRIGPPSVPHIIPSVY